MPYNVNYTDSENGSITVYDNTSNTDTSLVFPGRNVTGYGQIIAENFLHLLENFASSTEPVNPVEGQIWYNTDPAVSSLLIFDGSNWKAASGVQKSPVEPGVEQTKVGELWVDTNNQQLYVFSGTDWILVGPNFSTGLRSGPIVEEVVDSNDISRVVLILYVEDKPILITSKDSFTPKVSIPQFPVIRAGINLPTPNPALSEELAVYEGGFIPKLFGKATSADALNIGSTTVEAARFLRSDSTNNIDAPVNVRNDSGITFGIDGTFNISTSATSAKLYNNTAGASIDLQTVQSGIPATVLRVVGNRVAINKLSPEKELDVTGDVAISGELTIADTSATTSLANGALRVAGGVAVSKNVLINETLKVNGLTQLTDLEPQETDVYELGSATKRFKTIRAQTIAADSIVGVLSGSISGNAATATSLQSTTTFQMTGDISAPNFIFNGITGGTTKTFVTSISPTLITSKSEPTPNVSKKDDLILVYRPSLSGLIKETRDVFVGDLGVPIGTILPYAGANAPYGYLLCDGSEVERARYEDLWQILGTTYNGASPLVGVDTFRLPDLRGRFVLGKDNMDNGATVPTSIGSFVDAGGGNAERVSGVNADTLGGSGGQSTNILDVSQLPNHEHNMQGSTGQQYFATRSDTAVPLDSGAFLSTGGTTANRVQYLPSSGGIRTSGAVGQAFSVLNPYLALNYIIRSGPPAY
jgi:microcystin-dependent protein